MQNSLDREDLEVVESRMRTDVNLIKRDIKRLGKGSKLRKIYVKALQRRQEILNKIEKDLENANSTTNTDQA